MNIFKRRVMRAKTHLKLNAEFVLKDKDGNVKPLFQDNAFCRFLLKHDIITPHVRKIPFLFGSWTTSRKVVCNLFVNAGMAGVASRINGAGAEAAFLYIALGIGTTAPAAGNTALESEITTGGGERASSTASRVTTDVTDDTAQLVHTFNFTATFAITESGVLNAAAAGTLLARQTFTAVNVISGDALQITWKFDVD